MPAPILTIQDFVSANFRLSQLDALTAFFSSFTETGRLFAQKGPAQVDAIPQIVVATGPAGTINYAIVYFAWLQQAPGNFVAVPSVILPFGAVLTKVWGQGLAGLPAGVGVVPESLYGLLLNPPALGARDPFHYAN